MDLKQQLAKFSNTFSVLIEASTCSDCLDFADLQWPPFNYEDHIQRLVKRTNPGVLFKTTNRMMVLMECSGELRYYAGGCVLEFDTQPHELGVFRTVVDALHYADAFLVGKLLPERITVLRGILSAKYS